MMKSLTKRSTRSLLSEIEALKKVVRSQFLMLSDAHEVLSEVRKIGIKEGWDKDFMKKIEKSICPF